MDKRIIDEGVKKAQEMSGADRQFLTELSDPELVKLRHQSKPMKPREEALAELNLPIKGEEAAAELTVKTPVIGSKQVHEAYNTFLEYKSGKANLDARIVSNNQWYRGRHWEQMRDVKEEVQPTSGWLFNVLANKHADAMDNFPSPNVLPREFMDKAEAENLSSIIPVVLDQNNFEETYSDLMDDKNQSGTGVYGVFWDNEKHNGLGDIAVRQVDLLNIFWQPGLKDIQNSPNFFHVGFENKDVLISKYPQLTTKLQGSIAGEVVKYIFDDNVPTDKQAAVFDWYYKRKVGKKTIVHYCKFVGDTVLYASENEPELASRGYYDHGLYPFVFDVLYPIKGSPAGIGYIDVAKETQAYIDRDDQILQMNMLQNGKTRYFVKNDGSVKPKDFADTTKDFIPVDGNLGEDSIRAVDRPSLPESYIALHSQKIEEIKEVTGNRDVSTGGSTSGVTAASAIAAMQEAGSKLSRDSNRGAYRAYKRVCLLIIELIRQFYDVPRTFRILGENGMQKFISYTNKGIALQEQGGVEFDVDMGLRCPQFDIEVTAQKASPYSKMAQNEMALQFFGLGFFNPENATQALTCLDMMDFDRKQFVVNKIVQNGTLYQEKLELQKRCLLLCQMYDQKAGTNLAAQFASEITGHPLPMSVRSGMQISPEKTEALGGESMGESSVTKNARQRVAEATSPT